MYGHLLIVEILIQIMFPQPEEPLTEKQKTIVVRAISYCVKFD